MNENIKAFSIIFLGVCIVISSWFISEALKTDHSENMEIQEQKVQKQNRYEYIREASNSIMIFDKQTGDYWTKVVGHDWEKNTPISNQEN